MAIQPAYLLVRHGHHVYTEINFTRVVDSRVPGITGIEGEIAHLCLSVGNGLQRDGDKGRGHKFVGFNSRLPERTLEINGAFLYVGRGQESKNKQNTV